VNDTATLNLAQSQSHTSSDRRVHHRTVTVDGLDLFYREAGPRHAPTILLLHGFPTSSHMFRDLIPLLAAHYHVVAPDYPGFGYSSTPTVNEFAYTFDNLTDVIERFTNAIDLPSYALYCQDYGGPVGFRLATRHPQRVTALIIQNANAYKDGVTDLFQNVVLRLWTERTPETEATVRTLFELPITKKQYLDGAEDPSLVSPDAWTHAQWGMDRPGNKDIQYALQANYGSNVERYEEWHAYFREHRPPTLVMWGKGDFVFAEAGAHAYKRDLPNAEVHILNAGHFALETHTPEIAAAAIAFLARVAESHADANV
jgi:pimeloyl-ACP methyl ester carboxylesterase